MESTSRTDRRKVERQARKEQRQREKERRRKAFLAGKLFLFLIGVAVLGGVGYWIYSGRSQGPRARFVPSMGNRHLSPSQVGLTTYNSNPPTSGPHLPTIARWGIHENPIPKELQVHNLEDGGVLVQYNCDRGSKQCRELVGKLAQIVTRYSHAVLAPYPGMSHRIALTAWTRIDTLDSFDEERIVRFIDAYIDIDHHPRRGR